MYSCEKKGGYRERKKAEDRLLLHVKTAFFFFFFFHMKLCAIPLLLYIDYFP